MTPFSPCPKFQRAALGFFTHIDAALFQPLGQFIDSLIVGDINKLLVLGKPVLNKRNKRGHLLRRVLLIEKAQVIAILQIQNLSCQLRMHSSSGS